MAAAAATAAHSKTTIKCMQRWLYSHHYLLGSADPPSGRSPDDISIVSNSLQLLNRDRNHWKGRVSRIVLLISSSHCSQQLSSLRETKQIKKKKNNNRETYYADVGNNSFRSEWFPPYGRSVAMVTHRWHCLFWRHVARNERNHSCNAARFRFIDFIKSVFFFFFPVHSLTAMYDRNNSPVHSTPLDEEKWHQSITQPAVSVHSQVGGMKNSSSESFFKMFKWGEWMWLNITIERS